MAAISEILLTLSENRLNDPVSAPACAATEKNTITFMTSMNNSYKRIPLEGAYIASHGQYDNPSTFAYTIYIPWSFGQDCSLIVRCEDLPELEGMIVREPSLAETSVKWPHPKRPLFTPIEYPQESDRLLKIPDIRQYVGILEELGVIVGTQFIENIINFSTWLTEYDKKSTEKIWDWWRSQAREYYIP